MSYWHLLLQDEHGSVTSEKKVHLHELDLLQYRRLLFFIEGQPDTSSTWKFAQCQDETQVRDKCVCDLELRGTNLAFTTSMSDVQIRQSPLDPNYSNTSYLDLPFGTEPVKYVVLLRDGDQAVFQQHSITLKASFVLVPKTEANVEVASSATQNSLVKVETNEDEEAETEDDDDDDLDAEVLGQRHGDTQDDTQGPYSTSRERQSVPPSTPYDANTRFNERVHETPVLLQHAPLQQQTSTMSRVPDSLEYSGVRNRPAEVEESQLDGPANQTMQRTQAVDHTTQRRESREISPAQPDNEESSGAHDEIDNTAEPVDDSADPIDATITKGFHAEAESGDTASEGDKTESPEHSEPIEEDRPESIGEDQPDLTIQTPAPQPRGAKRKVSDSDAVTRTQSTKRPKRTEADRLAINNGTPIESTPSNPTQRRFSPRVMVSPSAPESLGRAPPRVLFPSESTILQRKGLMNFLKGQKVKQTNDSDPKSFDILCVEKGELKTTAKLLVSLLHGKTVVTDDWVVHSAKAKSLLDFDEFLPDGLKATKHKDRSKVFENMNIYFTPKLRSDYKKGWDDIHKIVEQAGAAQVLSSAPTKIPKGTEVMLYLGSEKSDSHVASLQAKGIDVFSKDIISQSILKGELVLDKEKYGLGESSNTPTSSAASASTAGSSKVSKASKTVATKAKTSRGKGKKK